MSQPPRLAAGIVLGLCLAYHYLPVRVQGEGYSDRKMVSQGDVVWVVLGYSKLDMIGRHWARLDGVGTVENSGTSPYFIRCAGTQIAVLKGRAHIQDNSPGFVHAISCELSISGPGWHRTLSPGQVLTFNFGRPSHEPTDWPADTPFADGFSRTT
jgi:hypothetical protein